MKAYPIEELLKRFQAKDPNPKTELEYTNHYTLLIAVVLSAQATDKSVNLATRVLFQKVQTPQDMVELGLDNLKEIIKSIGLYPTKAKNVIALSQKLIEFYHGQVPETLEQLVELPGVGRKTANVVLNVAFGKPTIAVDTHIHRVSNRLGLCISKTPEETEKKLLALIPLSWLHHAHLWLVLHGRYICKSRKPECFHCPVVDLCGYKDKNIL
jgi:endonuclease III